MIKFIGLSLIFLAIIMLLPSNSNVPSDSSKMYGIATLVLKDSTGDILFENVIHNQVVDSGTTYMLDQTFRDGGTDVANADQVDSVCVTDATGFGKPAGATDDSKTANDFNTENTLTSTNCIGNISFTTNPTSATTTVTFSAGIHFPAGTIIGGIGVCGSGVNGAVPFTDCDIVNQTPLLAVVDTSDVTVGTGESIDITYTLNLD